jgi:hypothetical protein
LGLLTEEPEPSVCVTGYELYIWQLVNVTTRAAQARPMFRDLDPGLYDNGASAKVKNSHSIDRAEKSQFPKGTGSP